jgi:hypothetical protein
VPGDHTANLPVGLGEPGGPVLVPDLDARPVRLAEEGLDQPRPAAADLDRQPAPEGEPVIHHRRLIGLALPDLGPEPFSRSVPETVLTRGRAQSGLDGVLGRG